MRPALAAGTTIAGLLAALPATAAAVPFGADLRAAPNTAITCPVGVPVPGLPPEFFPGRGQPTCAWTHLDPAGTQGLQAPGTGRITAVRVRVGPVTGPMRAMVFRAFDGRRCCTVQAQSQVFTPAPNAVTTVPVSLPVEVSPSPGPGEPSVLDVLGLAVLDPNTPVPVIDLGDAISATVPSGFVFAPAPAPGDLLLSTSSTTGKLVAMNAEWVPGPPVADPPGGRAVLPALPRSPVPVRDGVARLALECARGGDCAGIVRLLSQGGAGAAEKARAVVYGTAAYRLRAGTRAVVRVRMTAAGRRLLATRPTARVWASLSPAGGSATTTRRISLRRG
jgi:hypothetical protein